ncbi:MAG: TonB-dependent receptor [Pseudomonadota bacterium]
MHACRITRHTFLTAVTAALVLLPFAGSAAEDTEHRLDEVIVTAQKREQSLQKAPIAIAVMDDEQMEAQRIGDIKALEAGAIPYLRVVPVGNTTSNLIVAIRGNAPGDPSEVTRDTAVAMYLDGIYLARSQGLGMDLIDLERIEVLRGPQGSLFGRNAIGGAVSLVSKKPTGEFGLRQSVDFGRYDELRHVTRIDLPKIGNVSAKLDYVHSERDGWVDNTAPGQADYTEYRKDGGRLALYWQASDAVSVDYSFDMSNASTAQNYFQFYVDRVGLFGEELERQSVTRLPGLPLQPTRSKHSGHCVTVGWDIAENLRFESISGYRDLEEDSNNNYLGVLYFNGLNDSSVMDQDQFSQEFQLIGTRDRVEWAAGLYYLREDLSKTLQSRFTLDLFGVFGGPPLSPITPPTTFDALASGDFLPPRIIDSEARSVAAYGQATWNPDVLSDALRLTLGLRYTEDERSSTRFATALSVADQDSEHLDTTLAVDYEWTDSLSTYLKWSTGYKAGGVNTRSVSFAPFEEETAETVELGLKSEFWGQRARLNAAVFMTEYDDLQLDFLDPVNPTILETINAARKVDVDGLEIDLTVTPFEGLLVGASYSYLDDNMPLQPNPVAGGLLQQFYVPLAPKHAGAMTLDYQFEPWSFGTLSAHLGMTSTDDYFYGPLVGEQRTDSYTLWNARLTLADIRVGDGGTLKISAWAENLTDEEYIVFAFPVGNPAVSIAQAFGDPRTYGVSLAYGFR